MAVQGREMERRPHGGYLRDSVFMPARCTGCDRNNLIDRKVEDNFKRFMREKPRSSSSHYMLSERIQPILIVLDLYTEGVGVPFAESTPPYGMLVILCLHTPACHSLNRMRLN